MTPLTLLELEPRWTMSGDSAVPRHGMGLSFLCPVHRDHRLVVMFENPIDGLPNCQQSRYRWHRHGETFETLTLGPSIDASSGARHHDQIETPCWHGFIEDGHIR
jgi:hypothetical protein